jgi:hypothetical protein
MSEDTVSISPAKLAANRANAQKCTGPRTLAGKFRSSQNALKHGRHAGKCASYLRSLHDRMRELGEDPEEFAEIEDGLRTSFLPANEVQKTLVHDIALLQWQRRRLERAQAALMARRIQKLEIERERESLQVSQKISVEIPTAQLSAGLLWYSDDSPTKFQKLLEWLEVLRGYVEAADYAAAHGVVGWIYGPIPTVRGALIKTLFCSLAEAGAKAARDEAKISSLRLELLRETANIQAQYQLYLREHTELTPTMHEECLAPTPEQRALGSQISVVDRQTDQKIRLLLALQKAAADDGNHSSESRKVTDNTRVSYRQRSARPKKQAP